MTSHGPRFEVRGSIFDTGERPDSSALPPRRRMLRVMTPETSSTLASARGRTRNGAAILLAMALIAGGIGATWWYRHTGTPEYSLSQLGKAVQEKNYGKAAYYVDEDRIAESVSESLTSMLLAKYTRAIQNDPLPFTDTRINLLNKIAPHFHNLTLLGIHNGMRLLLSGNALLTGTSHFSQLDVHNFSQLHVVRSTVQGDIANVVVAGLPQPNPFGLTELRIRMQRIPNTRQWRIEEIPDITPIFAKYFGAEMPGASGQPQ